MYRFIYMDFGWFVFKSYGQIHGGFQQPSEKKWWGKRPITQANHSRTNTLVHISVLMLHFLQYGSWYLLTILVYSTLFHYELLLNNHETWLTIIKPSSARFPDGLPMVSPRLPHWFPHGFPIGFPTIDHLEPWNSPPITSKVNWYETMNHQLPAGDALTGNYHTTIVVIIIDGHYELVMIIHHYC